MTKTIKKTLIYIGMFLLTVASMYAFSAMLDLKGQVLCQTNYIVNSFTGRVGVFGILTAVSLWYLHKQDKKRLLKVAAVFGLIFSATYTIGYMFQYTNDLGNSAKEWFRTFGMILCFVPIPMSLFYYLTELAEKKCADLKIKEFIFEKESDGKRSWKTILIYWAVFFVAFIPAFLAYYPGVLVYDALYQYAQVHGGFMTTHHPLVHMILLKVSNMIAQAVGVLNLTFVIPTILQMLVLSFAFAYGLGYLKEIGISKKIRIIVAIVLAISPINSICSVTFTKDVFFAAFFLLFVIELLRFAKAKENTWLDYVILIGASLMMSLFRNNAFYALLVMIPVLVWVLKGKRLKIFVIMAISVVLYFGASTGMRLVTHALDNSSSKETFAMLLQQVARVYSYKEESHDDPEFAEITTFIPASLLSSYNPYIADGVKNGLDNDVFKANISTFLKDWVKIGLHYPGDYVEAFLCNTMGFWYLDDTMHARIYGAGGFMPVKYSSEQFYNEITPKNYFPFARTYYDSLFSENGYQNIPFLSALCRPAVMFFAYLIALLQLIYRKQYGALFVLIPVGAYFLTVLLAPVALFRYIYCLVCVLPFALLYMIEKTGRTEKNDI